MLHRALDSAEVLVILVCQKRWRYLAGFVEVGHVIVGKIDSGVMLLLNGLSAPPASGRCHILTISTLWENFAVDVLLVRHDRGLLEGSVKLVKFVLLSIDDTRSSIFIERLLLSLVFQTSRRQQNCEAFVVLDLFIYCVGLLL